MGALAGQERPGAAGPSPVEGPAIIVLAVAVPIVAIPHRTLRQIDLQQGIDCAHCVEDTWIVGGTHAEAHERQRVRAGQERRRPVVVARGPVLDRHEPFERRGGIARVRRRDTDVVALKPELLAQLRPSGERPMLDFVVPAIGGFA